MDLQEIMRMAQALRGQLEETQAHAEQARFLGEAGGGLVRAVMNGKHELVELKIDPTTLGPGIKADDLKLLEDLIRAAVNQAGRQVVNNLQSSVGSLAKNLGLDLSMLNGLSGIGRDKGGDSK